MPQAYVSGTIGVAAHLRGEELRLFWYGRTSAEISKLDTLSQLFSGAWDIVKLEFANDDELRASLNNAWGAARAVEIFQICLDARDEEFLNESLECLSELISNEYALLFLERRAYSLPIPPRLLERQLIFPTNESAGSKFFAQVLQAQQQIEVVRHEWSNLSDDLFGSALARNKFESQAIETGAFLQLVKAILGGGGIDNALLYCYQMLKDQQNFRSVINAWTTNIKTTKKRKALAHEAVSTEEADYDAWVRPNSSTYEKNQNVIKQLQSVVLQLQEGRNDVARKYAADLVRSQLSDGDAGFAAMSLCNLAQTANKLGHHSLQLEWLQEAVGIKSDDGWSHGQLGDAYLNLYRFEEARQEFSLASTFNDEEFGACGKARLHLARGELPEAYEIFKSAKDTFEGHPEHFRTWAGYAEALRKMHRYDESLEAYDTAIKKYGELSLLFLGRAHLLAEMGRLEDAISAYNYVIDRFKLEVSAFSGLADAFRQLGQYSEASATLDRGIKRLPRNLYLACSKANFLAATHSYDEAISEFRQLIDAHPLERTPWLGLTETLTMAGKAIEAVSIYRSKLSEWSHDTRLNNGFAKALRRAGFFDEALRQYEKNVNEFPFEPVSLVGRASLLKELGEYKEAGKAYDEVLAKLPTFHAAKFGKASLLAIGRDYKGALALLSTREPRSRADWVSSHVRAMVFLKQGNQEQAESVFKYGYRKCPFIEQRSYFGSGLALIRLRQKKFAEVADFASGNTDAAAGVFLLHSYFELGESEKAKFQYRNVNDNALLPIVRHLRDALAARYNLLNYGKVPSDDWISEQETTLLLQAA